MQFSSSRLFFVSPVEDVQYDRVLEAVGADVEVVVDEGEAVDVLVGLLKHASLTEAMVVAVSSATLRGRLVDAGGRSRGGRDGGALVPVGDVVELAFASGHDTLEVVRNRRVTV